MIEWFLITTPLMALYMLFYWWQCETEDRRLAKRRQQK